MQVHTLDTGGNCISANPKFIFLEEGRAPGFPAKLARMALVKGLQ